MTSTSLRTILSQLQVDGVEDAVALEGDLDRGVTQVRLIESIDQFSEVDSDSLIMLDRALSHIAEGYLMDVTVRRAVNRGAAGVMLIAAEGCTVSLTARALCRKSGLALIRLAPRRDVNAVLNVVARELADELHLTMDRARRAIEAIARLTGDVSTAADLAALGSRVLGCEIRLGNAPPPEAAAESLAVPVSLSQPSGEHFITERLPDADANALLEMVLWRLAAEASRMVFVAEQAERTSLLSVAEVLRQLVGASRETRDDLSLQARKLGIPIDGWHVVTRLELDIPQAAVPDGLQAYELRERLARVALTSAAPRGGIWHTAPEPAALWLLYSQNAPLPREWGLRIHRLVGSILADMQHAVPELQAYVGIGGVRAGLPGIAGSATEARLAAAHARSLRRVNHPVSFDALGVRTTIVEWYASPTVQKSIDALFAPLDDMAPGRRNAMVEILGTYLDLGGSIARTAETVHLHRNAVRARLQRALDLLGVDIDDADQRLFLHLACRSRRTTSSPTRETRN